MALSTTTVLTPAVNLSYTNIMLSIPFPTLIHNLFAMKFVAPAHSGQIFRMRRPNRLGVSPVPLGNSGVTTPNKTASIVNIDSKMDFYACWCYINEQTTLFAQDPRQIKALA